MGIGKRHFATENRKELFRGMKRKKYDTIEMFVKDKALDFAQKKISITHFVIDNKSSEIISFFAKNGAKLQNFMQLYNFCNFFERNDMFLLLKIYFFKCFILIKANDTFCRCR